MYSINEMASSKHVHNNKLWLSTDDCGAWAAGVLSHMAQQGMPIIYITSH